MQVCIFTEPNRGATYDDQLRFARHVEQGGFTGFFRSDHYQSVGQDDGLPGPTDAWVTLGALARETSTIRLGVLVSAATFRLPGPLAVIAAQVDQMSGGRLEFGLGAGWFEREHQSYGIPFPPRGERLGRMAEQLEVITGLWRTPTGQRFDHRGRYYTLVDSPALPKPAQVPGPPVIVGGRGQRRTPELAARFADEYNAPFTTVAATSDQYKRITDAEERVGRSASGRAPLRRSVGIVVACGRTNAEAQRRAAPLHDPSALPPEDPLIGSPAQLVDRIGEFGAIGACRVYLRLLDLSDLDHLDLIADKVLPQLR